MAMNGWPLEQWRGYFRTANSDIFDIIDHAIMVAALDCPKEFRLRRDRIAEKLFTCKFTRCSGCDRVELVLPEYEDDNARSGCHTSFKREADEEEDGCGFFEAGGSKESKANSGRDEPLSNQIASNYSYGEAEALTDEIEEESMIVGEVIRIKEILQNCQDESDSVLFESLRKLQLLDLTVDILEATGIGKAVNRVRKHSSKQIRHLAQTLIDGWKELVDEWVNATKAVAGVTPESMNPSVVDDGMEDEEEGLPSPPLDVGALFTTQPTSMELSQFFDGMDDDGNPGSSGEVIKNRNNGRRPSEENRNFSTRKPQTSSEADLLTKDNKCQQMKKQEPVAKPSNKPSSANVGGSGRPPKYNIEQKVYNESKLLQKPDKMSDPKKPLRSQQDKHKTSDEADVQKKLEATKRKLQERYQQVENAKRKRTIQVMELHDLPKQGSGHKNPYLKHGNHNRQWGNGKR